MKEVTKDLNGKFYRLHRVKGGLYGIEIVDVVKGKITNHTVEEENYPTVTMAKFNKLVFAESHLTFDAAQVVQE